VPLKRYSKELKFGNGMHVHVTAQVEAAPKGLPIALHDYNGGHNDACFTIAEAERFGRAWLAAAAACRAKTKVRR
jgi:hypothetical protein